jgi:hypothetical protein
MLYTDNKCKVWCVLRLSLHCTDVMSQGSSCRVILHIETGNFLDYALEYCCLCKDIQHEYLLSPPQCLYMAQGGRKATEQFYYPLLFKNLKDIMQSLLLTNFLKTGT